MRLPVATYRLQFRGGMDFDRAAALVDYLDALGASHLYASPVFTATTGSTHGYDITDPNEIDPALGGRDGLDRLSDALRARGMGLILDIVPNHMAFNAENSWLRDILRRGRESRFCRHFDIDMESERLRLPWLEDHFETVLEGGGATVADDPDGPSLDIAGLRVPLCTCGELEAAREDPTPDRIRALHAAQPWRLVSWRTEQDALTHRRFFNITGLVGVRVEDEAVFEDTHRLLFDLLKSGTVDGIRIDHIDGLADPEGYLDRLRSRAPDVPIWVEKILTGDERLPPWPIEGTTGYETARRFAQVATNADGRATVDARYREVTSRYALLTDLLARAKRQILTEDLSAELWLLHGMLTEIAADDPIGVEFGPEALRHAIVEFVAAFTRYRTYMGRDRIDEADAALVRDTAEAAVDANPYPGAIPFFAEVLLRRTPEAGRLRVRFQQVTGAVIAKSQEDTVFYREVPLLAANEVGGEPDDEALSPAAFARRLARRAAEMPHGLTLTSSHDTKRSEDARMRIAAITHAPEAFFDFHEMCAARADARIAPNLVWYLAQSVLALAGEPEVPDRLATHVEKALREAKRVTFWSMPDRGVEEPARDYARSLGETFADPPDALRPILEIADRLSLLQVALKMISPGIPDIYQGCEIASYAVTDPDNRREVDFGLLRRALDDETVLSRALDRRKLSLTRRLLEARRKLPDLFLDGEVAFSEGTHGAPILERRRGDTVLRLSFRLDGAPVDLSAGRRVWPAGEEESGPWLAITLQS